MAIERSLAFTAPFDVDGLLSFHRDRAIAGVEEVTTSSYTRSVWTSGGPAVVRLTPRDDDVGLEVFAEHDLETDLAGLVAGAREAIDLDTDPVAIDAMLGRDAVLAPLVARRPGIRVPGTFDPFELILRGIFGQQVSVAGARTALGRFTERFGTRLDAAVGSVTHLFPTPEQVAEIDPETLRMPRGRARSIRTVGELAATSELDLSDREEALRVLATVPGIGPWTLAYISMRGFRDPDAFLPTDLGVRRGFESLGLPATTAAILERAERWRPWRAYAVMHLWHVD